MATYKSTRVTANAPIRYVPGINCVSGSVVVSAALANNDVLQLDTLPMGSVFQFGIFSATDMDTAGSPSVTFSIGDALDDDRFGLAVAVGRTNADFALVSRQPGHLYVFPTDTLIIATALTVGTGAAGTFKYSLFYTSQL